MTTPSTPSPARSPRVLAAIALAYVAIGVWLVRTDVVLNDEGLCTYVWADWARIDLFPTIFFQKAKPVLSLLYLAPSALGARATMLAHVALAAIAIPLAARTARALGIRSENLAALVLAASPLYLLGGAGGLSNVDGVLGMALFLWLLATRRDLLAGVVLGAIPWARFELAVFSAIFFLRAATVERRPRVLLGAAAFPLAYALAGAAYHHDLLWILHFPPQTAKPMPGNPIWVPVTAQQVIENVMAVSPLLALAFAVRWRALSSIERALFVYLVVWTGLATVLPVWRLANFGFVPRYAMSVLPAIALLVPRVLDAWRERPPELVALAAPATLVGVWALADYSNPFAAAPILAGLAACVVLAIWEAWRAAALVAATLAALAPALPIHDAVRVGEQSPYLDQVTEWLRAHRDLARTAVYTNVPNLAAHLEGTDLAALDVRFLMGPDQWFDLVELTDERNGQSAAIRRLATIDFFGHGVPPDELAPDLVPDGAIFVLRADDRLPLTLRPPEDWHPHLAPLLVETEHGIFRFSREPAPRADSRPR